MKTETEIRERIKELEQDLEYLKEFSYGNEVVQSEITQTKNKLRYWKKKLTQSTPTK